MCAKSLQLCPTLCHLMDCSPSGSYVHGISQARTLKWIAISSSRGSSQPRDQTHIPYVFCIGRQVLNHYHCLGSPYVLDYIKFLKYDFVYSPWCPHHTATLCFVCWEGEEYVLIAEEKVFFLLGNSITNLFFLLWFLFIVLHLIEVAKNHGTGCQRFHF